MNSEIISVAVTDDGDRGLVVKIGREVDTFKIHIFRYYLWDLMMG